MTPLPKRRWSTRRQGKKRAGLVISPKSIGKCTNCGSQIVNHTACPICGYYKGKLILKVKQVENRS